MLQKIREKIKHSGGQSIMEMGIISFVLMPFIMFPIFDFANIVQAKWEISQLARNAARATVLQGIGKDGTNNAAKKAACQNVVSTYNIHHMHTQEFGNGSKEGLILNASCDAGNSTGSNNREVIAIASISVDKSKFKQADYASGFALQPVKICGHVKVSAITATFLGINDGMLQICQSYLTNHSKWDS